MQVKIKITGAAEVERELARLEPKLGKAIVRKALRASAKPVLDQARSNAEAIADAGATKAAMRLVVRQGRTRKTVATAFVAPNSRSKVALRKYNARRAERGATKPIKRLRHFHLAEFGRSWRGDTQPPRRWLTRAYDSRARAVPQAFANELRQLYRGLGL